MSVCSVDSSGFGPASLQDALPEPRCLSWGRCFMMADGLEIIKTLSNVVSVPEVVRARRDANTEPGSRDSFIFRLDIDIYI